MSQMLVNGDFTYDGDWSKYGPWTIGSGQAHCAWPELADNVALYQPVTFPSPAYYRLAFDLPSIVCNGDSSLRIYAGEAPFSWTSEPITTAGQHLYVFYMYESAGLKFYIDNPESGAGSLDLDNATLWNYSDWQKSYYGIDPLDGTMLRAWDLGAGDEMTLICNRTTPSNLLVLYRP